LILHITTRAEWGGALELGELRPASLADEGFIHCSTTEQMAATANKHYAGRDDMVLLVIDDDLVDIVWEDTSGCGQDFPHIYGPLEVSAVVKVVPYPPGTDGVYTPPAF
jgi:uncharacterized protein (DUF952 family)